MEPIRNYERVFYTTEWHKLCAACYERREGPWKVICEMHISRTTLMFLPFAQHIICTDCDASIPFAERRIGLSSAASSASAFNCRSGAETSYAAWKENERSPLRKAVNDYNRERWSEVSGAYDVAHANVSCAGGGAAEGEEGDAPGLSGRSSSGGSQLGGDDQENRPPRGPAPKRLRPLRKLRVTLDSSNIAYTRLY